MREGQLILLSYFLLLEVLLKKFIYTNLSTMVQEAVRKKQPPSWIMTKCSKHNTHRHTWEKGLDYRGSLLLSETILLSQLLVKLCLMSILKNQENTISIMKPTIKTQNVRVPETGQYLHLSPQLVMNSVLINLFLEYNLQRHNKFALKVNSN